MNKSLSSSEIVELSLSFEILFCLPVCNGTGDPLPLKFENAASLALLPGLWLIPVCDDDGLAYKDKIDFFRSGLCITVEDFGTCVVKLGSVVFNSIRLSVGTLKLDRELAVDSGVSELTESVLDIDCGREDATGTSVCAVSPA